MSVFSDEFKQVIVETSLHKGIPFPFDSDFVKLYFGSKRNRNVTYAEFSQFLHDFHDEYANVAFKAKDTDGSGFISAKDFFEIMLSIKSHLLTSQACTGHCFFFSKKIRVDCQLVACSLMRPDRESPDICNTRAWERTYNFNLKSLKGGLKHLRPPQ